MIQKSDVKVYLKAVNRGHDCIQKWRTSCEKAGLDYVFALRGWNGYSPQGNPVDVFSWDVPSPLRSEIETMIETSGTGLIGADLISKNPVVRGVAAAHCLPFWHNDRKYTINIDADDLDHEKDLGDLLLAALDVMEKSNTPVMSYDMHLSISDDKVFGVSVWPHVWCFGICLAETEFMKNSIKRICTTPWHAYCAWQNTGGINIDLALDRYFQYHFNFPLGFITKTGRFIHRPPQPPCPHGPLYHYYDEFKDFVIKDYRNWPGIPPEFYYREIARHPRTKVIDI